MQGTSDNGVYTISSSAPHATLLTLGASGDIWHTRLGHCGSRVLDMLKHKHLILLASKFSNKCIVCKMGKADRLPFTSVEHCFSIPLYLIHSDGWQSPIPSNLGYRYYVCLWMIALAIHGFI